MKLIDIPPATVSTDEHLYVGIKKAEQMKQLLQSLKRTINAKTEDNDILNESALVELLEEQLTDIQNHMMIVHNRIRRIL